LSRSKKKPPSVVAVSACWRTSLLLALAVVPGIGAAQNSAAAAKASPIEVKRFAVEGNTLLGEPELEEVLAPRRGPQDVAALRAAAAALQERYRSAGYGGVVVFLPEQTLSEGVVRLRVIEGKLKRIDIGGQRQFDEANVRASLPSLVVGQTPRVRRVDAEIQMANENPAKTLQVLLKPGAAPGEIAAEVTVQELPVWHVLGRIDNTGGKSTGRWRAALGAQHANVWNRDHVLTFEYQTAPEDTSAVRVFSGSYRAPVYGRGLAIDAYGVLSDITSGTVATAAGDLQFSGKGGIAGTRLNAYLPRWGNTDQRLALGVEAREYRNACTILGLGSCPAGANVSLQPANVTYTAQATSPTWQLRWGFTAAAQANLAVDGKYGDEADFQAVRAGARRRYALARLGGFGYLPLGELGQLGARWSAQWSDDALVPGETFGIGGASSVRGYEERELSADRGAQVSLELQSNNLAAAWPALANAVFGGQLRLLAFADAGHVSSTDTMQCQVGRTSCRLGSWGLGLRAQWNAVQLRVDVARAMAAGSTTAKGDTRAHAALNFMF
jgi:hemolysin activation/secretion protein